MLEVWQKLGIRRQPPEMGVRFEERKKQRNEAVLKEDYSNSSESIIQEDIDEMSVEMLDFALACFISEVRKEDGQEYPEK